MHAFISVFKSRNMQIKNACFISKKLHILYVTSHTQKTNNLKIQN